MVLLLHFGHNWVVTSFGPQPAPVLLCFVPRKPTIGLVDDDPEVLRALSRLLRAHELPVTTFASGSEYLQAASTEYDCLILDVQMPEMSGLELCAKLRSLGRKTPVIYITAHEDSKAEHLALNTGAVAFLYKPVRAQALCAAIHAATQPSDTASSL
jgi:FixJ family two-component response regulator